MSGKTFRTQKIWKEIDCMLKVVPSFSRYSTVRKFQVHVTDGKLSLNYLRSSCLNFCSLMRTLAQSLGQFDVKRNIDAHRNKVIYSENADNDNIKS